MKSKEIKKLSTLLKKSTQPQAVYTILEQGYEPSIDDLNRAGIADPRRVINTLRAVHGIPIYMNNRKDVRGNVTRRYRLGTFRTNG